ncbi:S-adenosyl-L-methionine-dependent methyltransferase [Flagelloscypha sp. PMI_526]|nr:S-adenosyl-L-methionine-dependent methyltransferase [Flagelloscypha sp. PMI_526]
MSQLSQLVSLIAAATKVVEAHAGKGDLDLDQITPQSNDLSSPEAREAVQTIEAACAQLVASVARPSHNIVNRIFSHFECACIRTAVHFKIPDLLKNKTDGVHVSELAKTVKVDQGKLARILRLLATKHIFREVKPDVFVNNRLSNELLSENGLSSLALHITDEVNKAAAVLVESLEDPVFGPSYAPIHTPFNKSTGYPDSLFSYYQGINTDVGGDQGARFGKAMAGWGAGTEALAVVNGYPWKDLPAGSTVVDVGGGIGVVTMGLAKAHTHLNYVLQDLPPTIKQAQEEIWPKQAPEVVEAQKISFKAFDFFKESPIDGADVYYLKNIIHDWPEKESITILSNIKAVLKPGSRVLVQEYVLQHAVKGEIDSGVKPAPEPLLPNWGVGRIGANNLDLDMMCMLNSQERYIEDFIDLGNKSGLKFVKLWDLGDTGVVEYTIA